MAKLQNFSNYEIYEDGRVWSYKINKFLSPWLLKGYWLVSMIDDDGNRHGVRINRAVALAYIPNPNDLPEVNHIDENKSNNHVSNLEWIARIDNVRHGTGIARRVKNQMGAKNKQAKKIIMCDKTTHEDIKEFDCIRSACDYIGKDVKTAQGNLSAVCAGRQKTAYGYWWRFAEN